MWQHARNLRVVTVVIMAFILTVALAVAESPPKEVPQQGPAQSPEQTASEERESPQPGMPKLPKGFTTNLTSPPMTVEAWNQFDEEEEAEMTEIKKDLIDTGETEWGFGHSYVNLTMEEDGMEGYWAMDEEGRWIWVWVCDYDWKFMAKASAYISGNGSAYAYIKGEGHTKPEISSYDPGTDVLLVGSFYVPEVAANGTVEVSLNYRLEAKMSAFLVYHVMLYKAMAYARIVIFVYDIDNEVWLIVLGPHCEVSDEGVLATPPDEPEPASYERKETRPQSESGMLSFSYPIQITKGGNLWIGVGVLLIAEAYAAGTAPATESGQTYAHAVAWIEDLVIRVTYGKHAFEECEAGYRMPDNHTSWVRPQSEAYHHVFYSLAYSRTWDAFRFSIGVPDYNMTLVSPTLNMNHTDGVIIDSYYCSSSNYVRRLRAFIKGLNTIRTIVVADLMAWDKGNATLYIYGPGWKDEVLRDEMTVTSGIAHYTLDQPIECHVTVHVVDENHHPISGAYVEVYDHYSDQVVASGYTSDSGLIYFILPHQGYYHFYAYSGSSMGFRLHAVLPNLLVTYQGPFPAWPDYGDLEIGMKRTGFPMGPPENYVLITLNTEATLSIESIAVVPPFPYSLKWINVSAQVFDVNWTLVASGVTPLHVSLPTGTYHVVVPENTTLNGAELRFVAWIFVDSPPTEENATVNLYCDRHIYAVYGQGFLLDILSAIASRDFGDALIMVVEGSPSLTLVRAIWGPPILSHLSPTEVEAIPRVVWTGVTPSTALLPGGNYILVAIADKPSGYRLVGWEGVDEDLGSISNSQAGVELRVARLNLTQDRTARCLHELESGAPLLIVRAKLLDGSELIGVLVNVAYYGSSSQETVKTPYKRRMWGACILSAEEHIGADIEFHHWEGVDACNGSNAVVNVEHGRLVWIVYEHVSSPEGASEFVIGLKAASPPHSSDMELAMSPVWAAGRDVP